MEGSLLHNTCVSTQAGVDLSTREREREREKEELGGLEELVVSGRWAGEHLLWSAAWTW